MQAEAVAGKNSLYEVNRISHRQKSGDFFYGIGKHQIRHGGTGQEEHNKIKEITQQGGAL